MFEKLIFNKDKKKEPEKGRKKLVSQINPKKISNNYNPGVNFHIPTIKIHITYSTNKFVTIHNESTEKHISLFQDFNSL